MKKDRTILFRITDEEFKILGKKVKDFRFRTISEYCRFVALNSRRIDIIIGDTITSYISGDK